MTIIIRDAQALDLTPSVRDSRLVSPLAATIDAQPRLLPGHATPTAVHPTTTSWRETTGNQERGTGCAAQTAQDGRTAMFGGAYVTTDKQFSIRSGPPSCSPPA